MEDKNGLSFEERVELKLISANVKVIAMFTPKIKDLLESIDKRLEKIEIRK